MIEEYRRAVGVMLKNKDGQIYAFRRRDYPESWQCPEGGIDGDETPTDAAFRELFEEVGLESRQVKPLAETKDFIRYTYSPEKKTDKYGNIGQEKKFFLFAYDGDDFRYDGIGGGEFTEHRLVWPSDIVDLVPPFKAKTYSTVINEFKKYFGENNGSKN